MAITLTGDGYNGGPAGSLNAGTTGVADGTYDGTITISGGNYTGAYAWNSIHIGTVTDGLLTIDSGAIVNTDDGAGYSYQSILAGGAAGSTGIINVDGAGTLLTALGEPGGIVLGDAGSGFLAITNSASVETAFLEAGRQSTGLGFIDVDGGQLFLNNSVGYSINTPGRAAFGRLGYQSGSTGLMYVSNGGQVVVENSDGQTDNPTLVLGGLDGSYGKATIFGPGSILSIVQSGPQGDSYTGGSHLIVGANGRGSLEIGSGATVSVVGDLATVSVSSAGDGYGVADASIDTASTLNIVSGGYLHIDAGSYSGGRLLLARGENGRADMLVSGAGSSAVLEGNGARLSIGEADGNGSLTIEQSGQIDVMGQGSTVSIGVGDGTGAAITQSKMYVATAGIMNVTSSGGSLGARVHLGERSDGNGYMSVDGLGSKLEISSDNLPGTPAGYAATLNVGYDGTGTLKVTNLGAVVIKGGPNDIAPGVNIGARDGSNGTVEVDGAGSSISITGYVGSGAGTSGLLNIGRDAGSTGSLSITNGGSVSLSGPAGAATIGFSAASGGAANANGTLLVDGSGSILNAGENLLVGASYDSLTGLVGYSSGGTGRAAVLNSGTIQATYIAIGDGGTIEGNGSVVGDITMDGSGLAILAPSAAAAPTGYSIGALSITGALEMTNGTLKLEIQGTGAGQYDTLTVSDLVSLSDGTIRIDLDAAYTPTAGDTFNFLTSTIATSLSFDEQNVDVVVRGLGAGFGAQLADTGHDLVAKILNDGVSPAIFDLGIAATSGGVVNFADGDGDGTGGIYDSFAFIGVSEVHGTDHADTLDAGNSATGVIFRAKGGDDLLISGSAADVLDGGTGNDTVTYASATAGLTLDFAVPANSTGFASGDSYTGIENFVLSNHADTFVGDGNGNTVSGSLGNDTLNGGAGNDTLHGDDGNDILNGEAGDDTLNGGNDDDTLSGGAGNDSLDGGAGTDTADYSATTAGIAVDLSAASNQATGTEIDTDQIVNVENVTGGSGDDSLAGDAGVNSLIGGGGNDTVIGGVGNDNYEGGAGTDTLSYATAAFAGIVNLATGTATGGGNTHTISQFENVIGSANADTITGDAGNNQLEGAGGADTLNGGAGADTLRGDADNDTLNGDDGNDILEGGAGDDTLNGGNNDDNLKGGAGNDTLDGGAGSDTADYSATTAGVTVDLSAATNHATGSEIGTDVISNVEIVVGGSGNDTLTGDSNANTLSGAGGDDSLFASDGGDHIDGGSGNDSVSYVNSTLGITLDLAVPGNSTGWALGDSFTSIESIILTDFADNFVGDAQVNTVSGRGGNDTMSGGGGNDALDGDDGDDTLSGDAGNDTLDGGLGNDTLNGGADDDRLIALAGNDTLDGGTGTDTVDYSTTSLGVSVDLSAASNHATGTEIGTDQIANVENVNGGAGNDNLAGDAAINNLIGGTGNDTIEGRGAADTLDGGSGSDTASYANSGAGVQVDLGLGTASGGDAAGDTLSNFENLLGSVHADTLTGDSNANVIDGNDGNDVIDGASGIDTLNGGAGNDTISGGGAGSIINGGDGDDTLTESNPGAVTINGDAGNDTIIVNSPDGADSFDGGADIDTVDFQISASFSGLFLDLSTGSFLVSGAAFHDFENINDTDDPGGNTLIGNAGVNVLNGNGGDDSIEGGAGADVLDGGSGTDTVSYSGSSAAVQADLGSGSGTGGDAAGDTLVNFENMLGSVHGDTLSGDTGANTIDGDDGDDTLSGDAGNDTLVGGLGSDTLNGGADDDRLIALAGNDTLDGGTGTDTVDYSTTSLGVSVDLSAASNHATGTEIGTDQIANVENVNGGAGNDNLAGDAAINNLTAGAGDDTVHGGDGDDTYDGGTGTDTINYSTAAFAGIINLGAGTATGGGYTHTLINFENAVGSTSADTITGDGNANSLAGDAGDDRIVGGAGNDALDGGAGIDTVDYSADGGTLGVTVDLTAGTATDTHGNSDTVSGFENIIGTAKVDTLTGDAGDNMIDGGLKGDTIDGGAGIDTVDYFDSTNTQKINLVTNVNIGGYAHNDVLTSIENVIGSNTRGDDITGNNSANVLSGMGAGDLLRGHHGDDDLFGGDGNDFLFGGTGADDMDGGNGLDWVMYSGLTTGVTVNLLTGLGSGGQAEGDTYTAIERVRGSAVDDTITGDDGINKILGDGGNDTINGMGGKDNIRGGAGNDRINGGAGNDGLRGDAGNDTFIYELASGHDFVIDFTNNIDTLELSEALWGGNLNAQQVVDTYMVQESATRFFLDFGGGDVLHVLTTSAMAPNDFHNDVTLVP